MHTRGYVVLLHAEIIGLPKENLDLLLSERSFNCIVGCFFALQIPAHVVACDTVITEEFQWCEADITKAVFEVYGVFHRLADLASFQLVRATPYSGLYTALGDSANLRSTCANKLHNSNHVWTEL